MTKLYLAYGSNLSISQMAFRCPDAKLVGIATIPDYEMLFKGSLTGSYATIEKKEGSYVPVAVWEISKKDEANLDRYEGYPSFYYKKDMRVRIYSQTGKFRQEATAMVYIMDERRKLGIPTRYYWDVLKEGYRRFNFDPRILQDAIEKSQATA